MANNKSTQKSFLPNRTRALTGIQPTGDVHIGNYFGAVKPIIDFSQDANYEVILMCADLHGLTNKTKIMEPGQCTIAQLALYLSLGFNSKGNCLILQSDFPQIQANAWYLSCAAPVGLLERAHAYKDALQNGKEPTCGLFNYPILMASDIMSFDAQVVPVGKDQAQHVEYASDMGRLFNNAVGIDVYHEAKPLISADMPILPGTDGRKMGKSYNNHIPVFATRKEIEKKVKEIKTDSKGLDEVKDPETCLIYQMFRGFASAEALNHMHERMINGTAYGYGHAKIDFVDEHERVFGSKRELYQHFCNSPAEIKSHMEPCYSKVEGYLNAVSNRARDALGLKTFR